MHSNRHVAPKVQRNLVRSRATAKQLSCTRTHTLLCGHCVLFCTRGGWLAATGAMSTPRARKKAKTSAERRLETLQGCHTNKFADIDFSKFQLRRAAAGDPMQVVPVKARSDALVQDWRDVGSYEPSGAPGYTTEQFMALCDDSTLRQHYTGPFGCKVQMSMPEPGGALCKAGKLVQGRSALQKLQKQLGVMCLRNIMGHFLGKDSAAISTDELQDANTAAQAVGGAGAMLTADEAAAWAPPAYPLFGDGLLLGGTLARQKQTLDSRTLELLRGEGAVVDKLRSGASGGAAVAPFHGPRSRKPRPPQHCRRHRGSATFHVAALCAHAPHAPLHLLACGGDVDLKTAPPAALRAVGGAAALAGALATTLAQAVAFACAHPSGRPHTRAPRHAAPCVSQGQRVGRCPAEGVHLDDAREARPPPHLRLAFSFGRGGEVVSRDRLGAMGAPERLHRQARLHFIHAWR